MNLSELASAAKCKDCAGGFMQRPDEGMWNTSWWYDPDCLRCKDHPGIDPDVMRWQPIAAGQDGWFVVIPVDPT